MEKWARFSHNGDIKFGKLSEDSVSIKVFNGGWGVAPLGLKIAYTPWPP